MPKIVDNCVRFDTYHPLPEDEEGLTPRQIQERRASRRRVSLLRYKAEMNEEKAGAVVSLSAAELARRLEIDEELAVDLKALAEVYLERHVRADLDEES